MENMRKQFAQPVLPEDLKRNPFSGSAEDAATGRSRKDFPLIK
jgi:hypothetical protein